MKIIKATCGNPILLGVQGENLARAVAFDISGWVAEYGPDGVPGLLFKQSEAEGPYPVKLERDGAVVRWPLTAYDMQTAGYGTIELRYLVGEIVVKSLTWATWVSESMTAGTPPEPLPDWVQAVLDAAIRAESWAVGGTGTRPGEDTNNAKYWAGQAQAAGGVSKDYVDQQDDAVRQYAGERGSCFAVCSDPAASPTSAPNKWYIPKAMPRPSGEVGMMVDVLWTNGHEGGLGYDVSLIWGEPGGADNEVIVDKANVSDSLTGEYSIPTEGTVRYQLYEQGGRLRWQYVSGDLIPKQYSTDAAADTASKPVHGLQLAYLPGMEIYVQMDKGNTAPVMRLVPDEGATLPVYGNGTGAATGEIPAGYILHLANAGDHWQIINTPGSGGGGGAVSSVNGKTGKVVLNASDVGAATTGQLDEAKHTTMVVTALKEGGGGYKADHTSTEIINHANAGGIVVLRYTDADRTLEIRMSGQTADRQALFFQSFKVPGENKIKRVDATVDYAGNVAIKTEVIDIATQTDLSGYVPKTQKINGKALSGDITLTATDVKARPDSWMPTAAQVGARPNTWTPTAEDVGAIPATPGTAGQFAQSDGAGGIKFVSLVNLETEGQ